jgi:hypothetical protein
MISLLMMCRQFLPEIYTGEICLCFWRHTEKTEDQFWALEGVREE